MEYVFKKLVLLSNVNKMNEKLIEYENAIKFNFNNNGNYDKLMKIFKTNVEYNAFDVNEDKQRQCYKQLKCFWPKCRYSNDRESELNKHISHHLNKRQFVCEKCNKQFNNNPHLLHHKRCVHSTDTPFVCNQINCNKRFKTNTHLTQHQIKHSSVKSFGCDKCDKRFKFKGDLFHHKKFVHSNIRQFVCTINNCNKKFKE